MKTPFSIQLPWPSMHLWHSRSPITLHSHILVSCTPLWCYWPGSHQTCWKPSDPHKFILVVTDQSVFCTSSGFFSHPSAKLNLAVLWVMAFLRLTLSSVRRGARHHQIFFSPNQKHLLVFFPNRRFVWGHQLHLPLLVTLALPTLPFTLFIFYHTQLCCIRYNPGGKCVFTGVLL